MQPQDFLALKAQRTEDALEKYVATWHGAPKCLCDAIRYSMFAGGKRLRPGLVLGAADIIRGDDAPALPAACAIEMIHTSSLIHDDLPAMDNDDLRRGRPTLHKAHGEAMAILAGDALLLMAFDALADTGNSMVAREIARAAGVAGMVGGQAVDMENTGRQISLESLRQLHAAKTGALIRISARAGALLSGASPAALDALTAYAEHVGLAFQIADDILDVTGTEADLGKPIGSDAANLKNTYPSIVGLERARELAREASDAAIAALDVFGPEADNFRGLARFVIERRS